MKVNNKFSPALLTVSPWKLYQQCEEAISMILDNRYCDPHTNVYEHLRHTAAEVFKHADELNSTPGMAPDAGEDLFPEETAIRNALSRNGLGRRINIVGDVGVGKTTFIKHIKYAHLEAEDFFCATPIYIDFADFNASLADPLVDIKRKFVDTVSATLEEKFGLDELLKTNETVFNKSPLFAAKRSILHTLESGERKRLIVDAMLEALRENGAAFTIERINALCMDTSNRFMLIVDNIDHLPNPVLSTLSNFLLQVELDAKALLLVCMRDQTYKGGFSASRNEQTVQTRDIRLKPPNLHRMLNRRIDFFFPPHAEHHEKQVSTGSGVLRIDKDLSKVCKSLLQSPFANRETYEFVCRYTNYNLRDLFANIQKMVGFHGYSSHEKQFFTQGNPILKIGIDECLISLALQDCLMFFPHRSPIFNPYSSGHETGPLDSIVAPRMLQFMDRIDWISVEDLKRQLMKWGYGERAIDAQLSAMISKDIVWTSTGSPANFEEEITEIKLSYRGHLYASHILRRTVFNYMMAFDVDAPSESHRVFQYEKESLHKELEEFADFSSTPMESDALALRVLGLAEIIFAAETAEIEMLKKRKDLDDIQLKVAPKSISMGIVDGLVKFLQKAHAENTLWRFMPPTTATLREVGEASSRFKDKLSNVFRPAE